MFCSDFCAAGANEQTGRNETAAPKIYAMPKIGVQDLAG